MVLKIRNVTKTYPGQTLETAVLRGVSLDLPAGSSLALTGDSGSGKSTLLHLAGALDRFDSGEIEIAGTPLSNLRDRQRAALRRKDVSLVFQQFNLIPSLSIWQNISLHDQVSPTCLMICSLARRAVKPCSRYPHGHRIRRARPGVCGLLCTCRRVSPAPRQVKGAIY